MMKEPIVIVTTAEQLRAIVADGVAEALAKVRSREGPDVMNREQVRALIRCDEKTLSKLIRNEGLPTLRRIGPQWRFSRREVLAWLALRKAG